MTPAILHRYTFPMREAMASLLGANQIDCDAYEVRIVGNCLVVDIVNPDARTAGPLRALPKTEEETRELVEDALASLAAEGSITIEAGTALPEVDEAAEPVAAKTEQSGVEDTVADPPFDPDPPKEDTPGKQKKPKGGPIAQRAGIICAEKAFHIFMDEKDETGAAAALRNTCGIESRAELDHNPAAAREFKKLDAEYQAWCRE